MPCASWPAMCAAVSSPGSALRGDGVGGLDWSEVKPLVVRHLGDLEIPVILYEVYRRAWRPRKAGRTKSPA